MQLFLIVFGSCLRTLYRWLPFFKWYHHCWLFLVLFSNTKCIMEIQTVTVSYVWITAKGVIWMLLHLPFTGGGGGRVAGGGMIIRDVKFTDTIYFGGFPVGILIEGLSALLPLNGIPRTQKLWLPSTVDPELSRVLSLYPGEAHNNVALHARDFELSRFCLIGPSASFLFP